jgi:TDG/mug DNA glycosylase family protein
MELLRYGVGVTNLADRPTRAASELSASELREGAAALEQLVREHQPRLVAIVGVTAYRVACDRPRAQLGLQPHTIGDRPVWVLPNPSGLNAHHQLPDLARLYGEARAFAESL